MGARAGIDSLCICSEAMSGQPINCMKLHMVLASTRRHGFANLFQLAALQGRADIVQFFLGEAFPAENRVIETEACRIVGYITPITPFIFVQVGLMEQHFKQPLQRDTWR
jgi:hypothetical protein